MLGVSVGAAGSLAQAANRLSSSRQVKSIDNSFFICNIPFDKYVFRNLDAIKQLYHRNDTFETQIGDMNTVIFGQTTPRTLFDLNDVRGTFLHISQFKKSFSFLDREGWRILRRALASI